MAKMIKKNTLSYINGYLCTEDGTIVDPVDHDVVLSYNWLERGIQKRIFVVENDLDEKPKKPVNWEDFEFETEWEIPVPNATCETPTLDKKIKEALKLADEIEMSEKADKLNEALSLLTPLLEWTLSDYVMVCETEAPTRFDGSHLRDPISLTSESVEKLAAYVVTGIMPHAEECDE